MTEKVDCMATISQKKIFQFRLLIEIAQTSSSGLAPYKTS
jgi:hypothetical protein